MRDWYALVWVVFGLCPGIVAILDATGPERYGSMVVLGAMGVGYALVHLLPPRRSVRLTYLVLLVPALGAMAALPGGGAALLILTLPQFWMLTGGPRQAVGIGGAAAAAVAAASLIPGDYSIWGNAPAALGGFAVSVPIGLRWHHSDLRARTLGTELRRTRHELAEAHRREGAAREHDRLAREIHDTLAQGFASIVSLAEAAVVTPRPRQRLQHLASIEATARENLAEARALIGTERTVSAGTFVESLQPILTRFTEDTGVEVDADLPDIDLDPRERLVLLRCVQESLANVRKHARASVVTMVLARGTDAVELEITDDGCGFDTATARGFGIDGMRRRLAETQAGLTVTSSVGDGTRILIELPHEEVAPGS